MSMSRRITVTREDGTSVTAWRNRAAEADTARILERQHRASRETPTMPNTDPTIWAVPDDPFKGL